MSIILILNLIFFNVWHIESFIVSYKVLKSYIVGLLTLSADTGVLKNQGGKYFKNQTFFNFLPNVVVMLKNKFLKFSQVDIDVRK